MIRSAPTLDEYYTEIASGLNVTLNPDYAPLVVPNGNSAKPLHRWFHLKEAFSCDLLHRVLKDLGDLNSDELQVLDPFAGVGTTAASVLTMATSGDLRRPSVYGIEANPFLHLVSSSKLRAHQEDRPEVLRLARRIAATSLQSNAEHQPPNLSTFHDKRYFDAANLQYLLRIRQSIENLIERDGQSLTSNLLQVALGSVVETIANLRRDGRALRFTKKTIADHPIDIFLDRCERIEEDIPIRLSQVQGKIVHGDGVTMNQIDNPAGCFDLIIFSPPYPNNIDYTEVYKLENWFLGFITNANEFRQQRLTTLHSHPSISRPARIPHPDLTNHENTRLSDLLEPVISALPSDRYRRGRHEVIEGYVLDMYRTLRSARDRLKPGGRLVYIVGNSAHGRSDSQFVIAADLLIAASARLAGLEVERLEVARQLHRRSCSSPFLRESVVFARTT